MTREEYFALINKKKETKPKKKINKKFEMKMESIENGLKITFIGQHYPKNVIQNWHRGTLLSYKKGIKKAASDAFLIYRKFIPKIPFNKVHIDMIVYNPRSRDDDANYDTLKWMRDTFSVYKIIKDDNRNVVITRSEKEIVQKEYKIEFYILNLELN